MAYGNIRGTKSVTSKVPSKGRDTTGKVTNTPEPPISPIHAIKSGGNLPVASQPLPPPERPENRQGYASGDIKPTIPNTQSAPKQAPISNQSAQEQRAAEEMRIRMAFETNAQAPSSVPPSQSIRQDTPLGRELNKANTTQLRTIPKVEPYVRPRTPTPPGTLTAAPRPPLQEVLLPSSKERQTAIWEGNEATIRNDPMAFVYGAETLGIGAAQMLYYAPKFVLYDVPTTAAKYYLNPDIRQTTKVWSALQEGGAKYGIQLQTDPGGSVGELIGGYYVMKPMGAVAKAVYYSPNFPKIRTEKTGIPYAQERTTTTHLVDGKEVPPGEIIFGEPTTITITEKIPMRTEVQTTGIEFRGKSQPLLTSIETRSKLPTEPTNFELLFLNEKPERLIKIGEQTSPVAQPRTATLGKQLGKIYDLTPEETTRIAEAQKLVQIFYSEKGLPVDKPFFNLKQLKNPQLATDIVIEKASKIRGSYFSGSGVDQLVPEKFRVLNPGDTDYHMPGYKAEVVFSTVEDIAKSWRNAGENVRVNPKNPAQIETIKGEKVLEVPEFAGGEEVSSGFLGYEQPSTYQLRGTRPFGDAKSTKLGENILNKASGSTYFRSLEHGSIKPETTPPEFLVPGVYPKLTRFKDLPDFVRKVRGGTQILKDYNAPPSKIAEAELSQAKFLATYTEPQKAVIEKTILERTGQNNIELSYTPEYTGTAEPTFGGTPATILETRGQSAQTKYIEDITGSYPRFESSPTSQKETLTYSIASTPAPSSIPIGRIPSPKIISPKISPVVSPIIPSPRPSPSHSPRPSPISSPSIYTPPSPSPGSPSPPSPPSPTSPSPSSPASPISPSPRGYTSPSPYGRGSPGSITSPSPSNKNDSLEGGFDVFVRRRGKFFKINKSPLDKIDAIEMGSFKVGNTAAATFKILPAPGRINDTFKFKGKIEDFYKAKNQADTWIEKATRRIKSPGEKQEITMKGIQANKKSAFRWGK